MIFAIYWTVSDTCDSTESTLLGYCQLDSKEAAEREFPRGFLAGFEVEEVQLSTPEALRKQAKERKRW